MIKDYEIKLFIQVTMDKKKRKIIDDFIHDLIIQIEEENEVEFNGAVHTWIEHNEDDLE